MTSHDREFMNRIVNKIIEIDAGSLTSYSGDYEFYEGQRAQNEKQQQAQFERQQAMLAKELKFIERFQGPRLARRSGPEPRQETRQDRARRATAPPPDGRLRLPARPRSGDDVVNIKGVHKQYGSKIIYDGFDFMISAASAGASWASNGAGKSTLLKLIAADTKQDSGTVTIGASVKLGYFAQHAMDVLTGDLTILQWLEERFPKAGQAPLRALSGCFGFTGDDVEKNGRVLSGGEKARLVMAPCSSTRRISLSSTSRTNHLDLDTKEMLIKALQSYEGTMLFVSHDRHFWRRSPTACWN